MLPTPTEPSHVSAGESFYPDEPPCRSIIFAVSHGQALHVEEWGQPRGLPVLLLHGGPGSAFTPFLRRYFDPSRYRVIAFDQRGCGRSIPRGTVEHNSTARLLDDISALRRYLGIDRWMVAGGSWGATLALAHALAEPQASSALLLRATFLARPSDIDWFFGGAAPLHPVAWSRLVRTVGPIGPGGVLRALADGLARDDAARRAELALAWWAWERLLGGAEDPAPAVDDAGIARLIDRYRVQSHYLVHGCWLQSPGLIERGARLPIVPTCILHGTSDQVCRPEAALALHRVLPHAHLVWADGAGHDPTHPAMVAATRGALDAYARTGQFSAAARAPDNEAAT